MTRIRLNQLQKKVLVELYKQTPLTVDNLPYTEEFERPYAGFITRTGLTITRRDVWKAPAGRRGGVAQPNGPSCKTARNTL